MRALVFYIWVTNEIALMPGVRYLLPRRDTFFIYQKPRPNVVGAAGKKNKTMFTAFIFAVMLAAIVKTEDERINR